MSDFSPLPNSYAYHDIPIGKKVRREYVITPEVCERFLVTFRDYSPIHVDEAYAKSCGFDGKVTHGALLNGFLSHFVGMHFPGRHGLLLAVDLRFASPCYAGDVIQIEAVVDQKLDARQVLILVATFQNLTRGSVAARGRVQVMLRKES